MNLKKSLTSLVLGLTLATGLVGTHGMAPAHASGGRGGPGPIGFPGPIIIPPTVFIPTIVAYGRYGTAYVSGRNFNPNSWLEVTFYVPGKGPLDNELAYTDAHGKFSMSWRTLSGCVTTPVSVDVTDIVTFDAAETTVVPGCIS